MNSRDLILRCYVKQEEGAWVAVCLDLNLAAQADSQKEVREKLEAMISTYVNEALTTDAQYADQLLTRRSPWPEWAKYYCYRTLDAWHKSPQFAFNEIMPVRPV